MGEEIHELVATRNRDMTANYFRTCESGKVSWRGSKKLEWSQDKIPGSHVAFVPLKAVGRLRAEEGTLQRALAGDTEAALLRQTRSEWRGSCHQDPRHGASNVPEPWEHPVLGPGCLRSSEPPACAMEQEYT